MQQSHDYLESSVKRAKVKEFERQIDQMVYKLYGLTNDEIKIVESASNEKDADELVKNRRDKAESV